MKKVEARPAYVKGMNRLKEEEEKAKTSQTKA